MIKLILTLLVLSFGLWLFFRTMPGCFRSEDEKWISSEGGCKECIGCPGEHNDNLCRPDLCHRGDEDA